MGVVNMAKVNVFFVRCIKVISLFVFGWILYLLLFCENLWWYACKKDFYVDNVYIGATFIGVVVIGYMVKRRTDLCKWTKCFEKWLNWFDKRVNLIAFSLLVIQIYICYNIFFETGWDPGGYIIPTARLMLADADISVMNDAYFSMFPNNLLLVQIYYLILKINNAVGIFYGDYQLMSIVIINCVIMTISCRLIYSIVASKMSKSYAFFAYVISFCLIGVSPWLVICYSDSLCIFIPVLLLYIYMKDSLFWGIKYPLILILGYLGFCIKPQALIIVIAIVIVIVLKKIDIPFNDIVKKGFVTLAISGGIIILLSFGLNHLYQLQGFDTNSDRKFGMAHYLMMGLNSDTTGIYSLEDVEFSANCKNQEERSKRNIEVALERIKKLGFKGYVEFISKKTLTNYNDGTFAWGVEGNFFVGAKNDINTKISPRMKSLYYTDGKFFNIYATLVQVIWICVICGVFLKTVFAVFDKNADYDYLIMILAVVGLTVFELLFEARARYLYIYTPIYIILGIYGFRELNNWIKERKFK